MWTPQSLDLDTSIIAKSKSVANSVDPDEMNDSRLFWFAGLRLNSFVPSYRNDTRPSLTLNKPVL